MSPGRVLFLLLGLFAMTAAVAAQSTPSQGAPREDYDLAFIGAPLPDPAMQHAKETYVVYGCAYCHGMNLNPRGEAADLMHSALVGADRNGEIIVPLLKAGMSQTTKLSPMPQFADLSEAQLHDLARYIHYARQVGRHKEIVDAKLPPGDAVAGRAVFDTSCASCHATDLTGVGKRYDVATLRDQMLMPKSLRAVPSFQAQKLNDTRLTEARQRHNLFVENSTPPEVANLVAYLLTK